MWTYSNRCLLFNLLLLLLLVLLLPVLFFKFLLLKLIVWLLVLFAVDGFDKVAIAVVPPLGQCRFLWFRMVAVVAVAVVAGDVADAFRMRKSILFRSQSVGNALIFGCLATGMISGNDDECSNLIASWSPLTSAKPRIFSISATFSNGPISSCAKLISPLYINSTTDFNSVHLTSRNITIGCWHGFSKNNDWKYGEQADSTILWAFIDLPSQANVTSTNDSLCNSWSNTFVKFDV